MNTTTTAALWICVTGLVAMAGCGPGAKLADVTGTVSVDGEQVEQGSIAFIPAQGQGPTTGAEIIRGKYASKAPLGESKVEIRVPRVVGQRKLYDTPDSPVQDTMEEVLPAKYNDATELRFEAKRGKNEKHWNLPTK